MTTSQKYFTERIHPVTKLAIIVDALLAEGASASATLRGAKISEGDLRSPVTRISINQILDIYRNAIVITKDPFFGYHTGLKVHLSAYGLYGFAILSSRNFRQTFDFAIKYHDLADPLVSIAYNETDRLGIWSVIPLEHPSIESSLYRFIVELQFGIHISLHRDVMGSGFGINNACFTYKHPQLSKSYPDEFGCPVAFSQQRNQVTFEKRWLDDVPEYGNERSYALTLKMCDELLAELQSTRGFNGQVRRILMTNLGRNMNASSVASRLETTPRTLRRKLRDQGLTFRQILDELRAEVASRYLRDTDMSIEDIAHALGFSDAANFRHAFRRWTNNSPQQFRESQVRRSRIGNP